MDMTKKSFFVRLLAKLGLCLKKDYDELEAARENLVKTMLEERENTAVILTKNLEELSAYRMGLDELQKSVRILKDRNDSVEFQTMEQYKNENEALKKDNEKLLYENTTAREEIKEGILFYNSVQKQLSEGFYTDMAWRFPYSSPIPGSSAIDVKYNEDKTIDVIGRFILDDFTNDRVKHNAFSVDGKIKMTVAMMREYRLYDRLIDMLLSYNLIGITLGYNDGCTSMECYYKAKAFPLDEER